MDSSSMVYKSKDRYSNSQASSNSSSSLISCFYSDACNIQEIENISSTADVSTPVLWRRFSELIRFTLARRQRRANISTPPITNVSGNALNISTDDLKEISLKDQEVFCRLCLSEYPLSDLVSLESSCKHKFCSNCLKEMITLAINEARVIIECPLIECNKYIHPNDMTHIVGKDNPILLKYEQFMVRRVLQTIPDSRWCPAPDCPYVVIATGCASCPRLLCYLCKTEFCYHCQQVWHPNKTCKDAADEVCFGFPTRRTRTLKQNGYSKRRDKRSQSWVNPVYDQLNYAAFDKRIRDSIKRCPCCKVVIMKVDDGSCNHMTCSQCGSEFCWLCLKVITDLHFLSPSGCTFWGRKRWSRKKKVIWQCLALVGAPLGISIAACVSVPAIFIGLPVWAGRKTYKRFAFQSQRKRNTAICVSTISAVLAAPVIASATIVIGVPVLLTYTYAVIPMSMCRSDTYIDDTLNLNDEISTEDNAEKTISPEISNSSSALLTICDASYGNISNKNSNFVFTNSFDSTSLNKTSFRSCYEACGTASGIDDILSRATPERIASHYLETGNSVKSHICNTSYKSEYASLVGYID